MNGKNYKENKAQFTESLQELLREANEKLGKDTVIEVVMEQISYADEDGEDDEW